MRKSLPTATLKLFINDSLVEVIDDNKHFGSILPLDLCKNQVTLRRWSSCNRSVGKLCWKIPGCLSTILIQRTYLKCIFSTYPLNLRGFCIWIAELVKRNRWWTCLHWSNRNGKVLNLNFSPSKTNNKDGKAQISKRHLIVKHRSIEMEMTETCYS